MNYPYCKNQAKAFTAAQPGELEADAAQNGVDPNSLWIGAKTKRILGEYVLGGFLYVGEGLASLSGFGTEPALIDAKLPVVKKAFDLSVRRTDYWPSYRTSSPEARGAYLQWLSGGKVQPDADIGLVFLYFYGLERRALADPLVCAVPEDEHRAIEQEVRRLLGIYTHRSFQSYAQNFLDVLEAKKVPDKLYLKSLPKANSFTLLHRIALAQCAADQVPLPLHWALAWLELDASFALSRVAKQCRREFRELFAIRYGQAFGKGLILSPGRAPLSVDYRPASPSFNGLEASFGFTSVLHEVNAFSPGAVKLNQLAEECCQALSGYARSVLKSTSSVQSSGHLLELPYVLWAQSDKNLLEKLRFEIKAKEKPLTIPTDALKERLGEHLDFGKAQWRVFSDRLAEAGIGVEPAATVSGQLPSSSTHIALFLPCNKESLELEPSCHYRQAAIAAQLSLALCFVQAGHTLESPWLLQKIEDTFQVPVAERPRLAAHLYRVRAEGPRTTGLKGLIVGLETAEKEPIGQFLLDVSGHLGPLSSSRLRVLESAFKALSLPVASLPELPAAQPEEPALVAEAQQTHAAHPIRPPGPVFVLDAHKIRQLENETREVAELLSGIFVSETEPTEESINSRNTEKDSSFSSLWGLDAEHSALACVLAAHPQWSRESFETLCAERGLLPDGALETLNEACMDALNEPFIEGTGPIDVYCDLVKEHS